MKLGSLFDGIGGFPLAGAMHGIRPVWASEIEPFPIRVTKLRFPDIARSLCARADSSPCVDRGQNIITITAHGGKASEYDGHNENIAPTIRANANNTKPSVIYGNNTPIACIREKVASCMEYRFWDGTEVASTLTRNGAGGIRECRTRATSRR